MSSLAAPEAPVVSSRRRWLLELARYRAIVHEAGTDHPEFGWAFMAYYLPHYLRAKDGQLVPPAAWHPVFFRTVFSSIGTTAREVYLAPRGYAKSTIVSTALPLVVVALQLREYGLLVQDAGPQAKQALEAVMHEVEGNERLRDDFPHLTRIRKNTDEDVVWEDGTRLQAVGSGMKLRGRRQAQYRPDLALIDDLENDENVATKYQRDKLDNWLSGALLPALGPDADVHYVGTLLHHDAVLARIMKRDGWTPHTFRAVTDPSDLSTTTWPEYWPADRLALLKRTVGSRAFAREVLHQPVDEDAQLFPRSLYRYKDVTGQLVDENGKPRARVVVAVDPATGEKATDDYSAIASMAQLPDSPDLYLLDTWRGRKRGDELVARVVAEVEKWKTRGVQPVVVFESVQAQVWGAQALRAHGLTVREVKPHRDKVLRAEPASIYYENGEVWHSPHLRDGEMETELEQFPAAEHDDQVDAMVYAALHLRGKVKARVRVL